MKPGATALTVMPRDANFPRHRFGKSDNARFGRGVKRLPDVAHLADHRREIDDPAVPLPEHVARDDFSAENRALEIGADNLIPIAGLHAHQEIIGGDSGIVDENINFFVARQRYFYRGLDLILVGDIEVAEFAFTA